MRRALIAALVLLAACIERRDYQVADDAGVDAPGVIRSLTVTRKGGGVGYVASTPAGIDCGNDCSESYAATTVVDVTADPEPGSELVGWSDTACGRRHCLLTVDRAIDLEVQFELVPMFPLTVARTGPAGGSVQSSPAGIDCGVDCDEAYPVGTVVQLTPTVTAGTAFVSWSGACGGSGACLVTMTSAQLVTAAFAAVTTYNLQVLVNGSGSIRVTPPSTTCTSTCNSPHAAGELVRLDAAPDVGWHFTEWSGGGCTGHNPTCMFVMGNAATMAFANFELD